MRRHAFNRLYRQFHLPAASRSPPLPLSPSSSLPPLFSQNHRQVLFSVSRGELESIGPVSHLRLTMYPDGGISRLRAFGTKANGGSRL
jgi:hypothetical protein